MQGQLCLDFLGQTSSLLCDGSSPFLKLVGKLNSAADGLDRRGALPSSSAV